MRIIIWGLPLHSHTHSYIHQAFTRASKAMGYETFWVDDCEESNNLLTDDSLVICCGISDAHLRHRKNTKYVLHNSSREDLKEKNAITLQVYTHDVLKRSVEKFDIQQLSFWENSTKTLYQPWATDLLPEEIKDIEPVCRSNSSNDIFWIGSITTGLQGNYEEIIEYAKLCEKDGSLFKTARSISIQENILAIRASRHSPAIQGKWQIDNGYIPCRVFKNISYGQFTLTNSQTVAELLDLSFCKNIHDLYDLSESQCALDNSLSIKSKMSLVSQKHTYVNRLSNIIKLAMEAV